MRLYYCYIFFIALFSFHNLCYTQAKRVEKLTQIIKEEEGDAKTQALLDASYYLHDINVKQAHILYLRSPDKCTQKPVIKN